ncbi:MAG: patatin-like phospholipase family protein [Ramlibacter sp.]
MTRILSIDGGGFRGVIPAHILQALQREAGGTAFTSLFDVFAGTSTGAILCAGLTAPRERGSRAPRHDIARILDIYRQEGPVIFRKKSLHELNADLADLASVNLLELVTPGAGVNDLRKLLNLVNRLRQPLHDLDVLMDRLEVHFSGLRMGDALRRLMLATYDLNSRQLRVIDSSLDPNRSMPRMVGASAAAPGFFAPAAIGNDMLLTDGGMGLSNPALYAVARLVGEGVALQDITVVSLGTGAAAPATGTRDWNKWERMGPLHWLLSQEYLTTLWDGSGELVDYTLSALLGPRYHRLQVDMDSAMIRLDDGSGDYYRTLVGVADAWITARRASIQAAARAVRR